MLAVAAFWGCGGSKDEPEPDPDPTPDPVTTVAFARGADVSWVSEMEAGGMKFTDSKGASDIFTVLKNLGMNAIRLRVWVDPYHGWSGKDDVVNVAKKASDAGMAVMVDFHYSDFFADPSYQDIPSAWTDHTVSALASKVGAHTTEVMTALKSAGVTPQWIQTGNETRNGMLWPAGQLWTSSGDITGGWNNFATLVNAGYDAAKAVFPEVIVMCHLNNAWDDNDWWFTKLKAAGGKFDMIGLSHYPMSESGKTWSQMNSLTVSRIKSLASKYSCKVMVCEVGVKPSSSDAGSCMDAFMSAVKGLGSEVCAGVFYWEPEVDGTWKPAVYSKSVQKHGKTEEWNAYDMGAFSRSGSIFSPITSILGAFAE